MQQLRKVPLIIVLLAATTFANDVAFKITRAEVICGLAGAPERIEFTLDRSLNVQELLDCEESNKECKKKELRELIRDKIGKAENYLLLTIDHGIPAVLTDIAVVPKPTSIPRPDPDADPQLPPTQLDNMIAFNVSGYQLASDYVLMAKDLTLEEKKQVAAPFLIKVTANSGCSTPPADLPEAEKPDNEDPKTPGFVDYFGKPGDGATPHLKVDFSMQGSKKKQVLYNFVANFRPYTKSRLGFGGFYEVTPFFIDTEYRINASAADKKNVLNIGVFEGTWIKVFRDDGDESSNFFTKHSPALVVSMTPKLETEWGLQERNLLISPRATLAFNIYQSRRSTIRINPFIGFEYGFVWASKVNKPGSNLQRPLFGSSLTAGFFRKNDKPLFLFEIDYIRRFFLRPELSYGPDQTDKLVPDRLSKLPRDDTKARVTVNATELFAPFVEYEYGRVPPKYNLIDHSFRTGIAFNVDVVWKSFK